MTVHLLMTVLVLVAAALLCRPWWTRAATSQMQRRSANVTAYETRLRELDNDHASGLLDAGAVQALKQELAARLLCDAAAQDTPLAPATARGWKPAVVLALGLSAFAAIWYWSMGSWRTQTLIETARANPEAGQSLAVQAMVDGLAARLQENPDDVEGWSMLGRSYFVMRRYADSASAYARASELSGGQDANLLVNQGEALAMIQENDQLSRALVLFDAALALDASQPKALWYAGLAAAQRQDDALARRHWFALRAQELPEGMREVLDTQLQELAQRSGEPLPQNPAAVTALRLEIEVDLAPALAGALTPDQTLFVFAKSAQGGPPMPLAVQRLTGVKFPLTVTLDDSMAMMPSLRLSQFDHWVVTARLTRGGAVQPQSGDLQGQLRVNKSGAAQHARVVIDQILP